MVLSASIQLSSWHIIAIFVFIGFLFHYFQTKESKKSVIGSILIGVILGVSLGLVLIKDIQLSNIQLLIVPSLISIISVLTGGVIAVSLKKAIEIIKRRNKPIAEMPKNEGK